MGRAIMGHPGIHIYIYIYIYSLQTGSVLDKAANEKQTFETKDGHDSDGSSSLGDDPNIDEQLGSNSEEVIFLS